jgi:large subunit ribosomal protein L5e
LNSLIQFQISKQHQPTKKKRRMGFVKQTQSKSYYKRFQVKPRRRRSGQTDYYARTRLIRQAKDKYNTPKYRIVVRFTNTRCIAQVIYATLQGDKVLAQADSFELKRYGLTVGLKNYPAAYCTGLLLGRRTLQKLGLDKLYPGNVEVNATTSKVETKKRDFFVSEVDDDRRPFRCYLDVGLARTTVGAKIFAAMKGASDGGLDIPHNEKNFRGYDREEKKYDPEAHRAAIFGEAIKGYQEQLIEDDQESGTKRFKEHFGSYEKAQIGPDDLEELYQKVHAAIRADPSPKHKESKKVRASKMKHSKKYQNAARKTPEQRKKDIAAKVKLLKAQRSAAGGDEKLTMTAED